MPVNVNVNVNHISCKEARTVFYVARKANHIKRGVNFMDQFATLPAFKIKFFFVSQKLHSVSYDGISCVPSSHFAILFWFSILFSFNLVTPPHQNQNSFNIFFYHYPKFFVHCVIRSYKCVLVAVHPQDEGKYTEKKIRINA